MSNKVGRPSKYKVDYCAMLVVHMAEGLSFESFAGAIGVDRDTIYEWVSAHEEFSDAKKDGAARSQLFWERIGVEGMVNDSINATLWIFNMKNRFKWRDKSEDEIREEGEASSLKECSDEELRARLQKLRGNGK